MLCPSWARAEGKSDHGWCGATLGFDILRRSSEGVDLAAPKSRTAEWPGNFFGGSGTARLYISASASAEQRRELEAIFWDRKGWRVRGGVGAVAVNWLPTETTSVEIPSGESPSLRVCNVG